MLATVPLAPLRCNYPNLPKGRARYSNSCSPSSFGTALPSYTTCHKIPSTTCGTMNIQSPSMRSARRLHAYVDALRSNCNQDIALHIPNSLCKPAGRANEDCRRTFHHKPRYGCQTNLTCLPLETLSHKSFVLNSC